MIKFDHLIVILTHLLRASPSFSLLNRTQYLRFFKMRGRAVK